MPRHVSYPSVNDTPVSTSLSPLEILNKVIQVDGLGSGLDADLVDGHAAVQQGAGPGQLTTVDIKVGHDGSAIRIAKDDTDLGIIVTDINLTGILKDKRVDYYTPAQVYEAVATSGGRGTSLVFDAAGNLYWTVLSYYNGTTYAQTSYVYKITPQGALSVFASAATIGAIGTALIFDAAGNLYWTVTNHYNGTTYNLTSYVYKITPAGSLSVFASATLNGAFGTSLAFDAAGNLYWAAMSYYNGTTYVQTSYVYKITPAGSLSTFASVATNGANGTSLAFDAAGNLYWAVSNLSNGTTYALTSYVYKITSAGSLSTFASVATNGAADVALLFDVAGNLYWAVSNSYNGTTFKQTSYVYKITPAGTLTTLASMMTIGAYGTSLLFDLEGNLYWGMCNSYNGTVYNHSSYIYKITPQGIVSVFAEVKTSNAPGTKLLFDAAGNLYWAITNHYTGSSYNLTSYLYRLDLQDVVYDNP